MKTFGSVVLGFLMFIFVFVISLFLGVRLFFSPVSMSKLAEILFEEEGGLIEELMSDGVEYAEYLNEKEINEELGEIFSDYIKFIIGIPDQKEPSFDGLKQLIDEAISEYEKETGMKVDLDEYNREYQEMEKEFKEELLSETAPKEVQVIFSIIYSNTLMFVLIALIIVCAVLDYLIRKDILLVSLHSGIVSLVNSFLYGILWLVLFVVDKSGEDASVVYILELICNILLIITIIGIILGIVLVGLSIVLRNKKRSNNINNGMYNNGFYQQQPVSYSMNN